MKQLNLSKTNTKEHSMQVRRLTDDERLAKLSALQNQTFREMLECLETYGICNVVRPTGFGKTKMFMDLAKAFPGESFIYIFDINSVVSDIRMNYNPKNVEFISYSQLSRKDMWDTVLHHIVSQPRKAIIFDESHLMGGTNVEQLIGRLVPLARAAGVWIVGGTATKLRTDLVDVSARFFDNHECSEYSARDAVSDGIMLAPVCKLTFDRRVAISKLRRIVPANSYYQPRIRQLDAAYAKLNGVAKVYRDTVVEVYKIVPNTMRFIVFYPTIKSLNENADTVINDFKEAFPTHKIYKYALSSDPDHYSDIAAIEHQERDVTKYIELIFAVSMLNQAYHSAKLTGIVMNRYTISNIVFTQQLGRIMSVMATVPGIVFDNVGNVDLDGEDAVATLQRIAGDQLRVVSGTRRERGHCELTIEVSPQDIEFMKLYSRIMATKELTNEDINRASRNWKRHRGRISLEQLATVAHIPYEVLLEEGFNG